MVDFPLLASSNTKLLAFSRDLILAGVMGLALKYIYIKFSNSLSNRRLFSNNFIPLAMTTMMIIMIVKSSLALSLGLVGALSIVRFRTAIKEPEEIIYLFVSIGIGLGAGASQIKITLLGFLIISITLIFIGIFRKSASSQNLYLTVSSLVPKEAKLEKVVDTLKANADFVDLKRFEEDELNLEATFHIEFSNFQQLTECKNHLQNIDQNIKIVYLENKALG